MLKNFMSRFFSFKQNSLVKNSLLFKYAYATSCDNMRKFWMAQVEMMILNELWLRVEVLLKMKLFSF